MSREQTTTTTYSEDGDEMIGLSIQLCVFDHLVDVLVKFLAGMAQF